MGWPVKQIAFSCGRHCQPSGRANAIPDDVLRQAIHGRVTLISDFQNLA